MTVTLGMRRRNYSSFLVGLVRRGPTSGPLLGLKMLHNQCIPSITPTPTHFSKTIFPNFFYITQSKGGRARIQSSVCLTEPELLRTQLYLLNNRNGFSAEIQHAVLHKTQRNPELYPIWHVVEGALGL